MYVPHYPYKSKMRKTVSILPGTSSPSFALERDLKERGEAERRANRSESHAVARLGGCTIVQVENELKGKIIPGSSGTAGEGELHFRQ